MEFDSKEVKSSAQLAKDLMMVVDRSEELTVRCRVHRKSQAEWANAMRNELKETEVPA